MARHYISNDEAVRLCALANQWQDAEDHLRTARAQLLDAKILLNKANFCLEHWQREQQRAAILMTDFLAQILDD